MFIYQFYTGCLSEAAYFIESNGEAAVIDPLRDTSVYIELAKEKNARIKYIFETHFHADFVSGHLDLALATGAPIIYGPGAAASFASTIAADGQVFPLGNLSIEVLHTPGHTPESSCFLLKDEKGHNHCVFTGDTLFVGDVGRPDLAQKQNEQTVSELAGILYDSIQSRLMPLADDVIVYPAHGPGSACAKNPGTETASSIGTEKKSNYALLVKNKEEFIQKVTEGIPAPPPYFEVNAFINKTGYEALHTLVKKGLIPVSPSELLAKQKQDIIILDTRPATVFTQGFIPGSVFIGLEGRLAEWAGNLLPFDKPVLLVTEPGKEEESIIRLARVGFSQFAGCLQGGFPSWLKSGYPYDMIIDIEADELMMDLPHDMNLQLLDVRRFTEFAGGHLRNALNIPLEKLCDPGSIATLEENQNLYLYCAGGYRSVIAASLLKKQGHHNLRNILGGWDKIKEQERADIQKENSVMN